MATDLETIKQLEKEIGIELKELEGEVSYNTKAYKTDSKQNVTGLYLKYVNLKKIPLIILQLKNLTELHLGRFHRAGLGLVRQSVERFDDETPQYFSHCSCHGNRAGLRWRSN